MSLTDLTTDRSIDRSTDWPTDRLTNLPTDRLTARLTNWLTDWLTYWPTHRRTNWPTDRLTDRLTDWLTSWLIGWLIDCLIDWQANKIWEDKCKIRQIQWLVCCTIPALESTTKKSHKDVVRHEKGFGFCLQKNKVTIFIVWMKIILLYLISFVVFSK